MKDIFDSVFQQFNNRLRTPFYGLFASWWVVLHFEFFYTLLFVDESKIYDKTGLLKNEYLRQEFWQGNERLWVEPLLLIVAFLLTLCMIFVLPRYVLLPIYKREQDDYFRRKQKRLQIDHQVRQEQLKLEQSETATIKALEKTVTEQSKARKKIEETDPTALWRTEFETLKQMSVYNYFYDLIEAVYEQYGMVERNDFVMDKDLLAYLDANKLVAYSIQEGRIELTDKGKYFINLYQTSKIAKI